MKSVIRIYTSIGGKSRRILASAESKFNNLKFSSTKSQNSQKWHSFRQKKWFFPNTCYIVVATTNSFSVASSNSSNGDPFHSTIKSLAWNFFRAFIVVFYNNKKGLISTKIAVSYTHVKIFLLKLQHNTPIDCVGMTNTFYSHFSFRFVKCKRVFVCLSTKSFDIVIFPSFSKVEIVCSHSPLASNFSPPPSSWAMLLIVCWFFAAM